MLLIDGMMLAHRCHAKMDFLKNTHNEPTGMEFGFLRTVEMLTKKYEDMRIVVCWESPDGVNWRKQRCPSYKVRRSRPTQDFFDRLRALRTFLRCFWDEADASGYEADDVMFSLSRTDDCHRVYTNDDDLLQAVSPACSVVKSFESKLFEWDEATVREKYGVAPEHLPELRAFLGDGSDALPGVKRVDRKYLADLIEWAHSAELSAEEMLSEIEKADFGHAASARIAEFIHSGQWSRNYELMRLNVIPLAYRNAAMNDDVVIAALQRWEIRTLRLCETFRDRLSSTLKDEKF